MLVDFDLPDLPDPGATTSNYWVRYYFVGSPSQDRQINALANTYMRLVEAATVEYKLGAEALRLVWSDHSSFGVRAMHRSISHFETCVSSMHRAIATFRRLRNHPSRDPLSAYLTDPKPAFISDAIAFRVRNVRDAVHHLEEQVVNGEVTDGQPIALKPEGKEVPHPIDTGQTVKTFDRLAIGAHELTFSELATWLSQMETVAARIAQFDPRTTNP